ncbi:MAG: hypothetical protein P4L72_09540 [Parvibaculum sp.]|uniref:hypothetical protein n=1 Tax=Parvibaculum sp. TaxID=2024848 RepID=UPI0028512660|nr:hypothetical protein [Parvibaculum sp.]MDR3499456.1 hypothetical protein [Parvibaculum sp.]
MSIAIAAILLLVGLLNFYPVIGAVGAARLAALYGLPIEGPDLAILMRHRALLFGLVGAFIVSAAFAPGLRVPAFIAGFVSMGGFIWIARSEGTYGRHIRKVVIADIAGSAALLVAAALHVLETCLI